MSWCGGGEIRGTPGTECRRRAISAVTLCPGSCPPSPGFDPWAILISSSSARTRYCVVTPKRPEATCSRTRQDPRQDRPVRLRSPLRDRLLHRAHEGRRPPVVFPVPPVAHAPVVGQRRRLRRRGLGGVRRALARDNVLSDLREPDAADGRNGAREATVHHLGPEPQRLEDLRSAV